MTGNDIRGMFLKFFAERDHRVVLSSSLVPANDPTLLFANAGMNQFKDVFLVLEQRDYRRATSCQKCVRAGGKHNDLENVGFTNRHHTFFEMLGNFSFGDYFKKEAIAFAWELITGANWYAIPKDKLYVTIFKGESGGQSSVPRDVEAGKAWLAQGVAAERIFEFGSKDNFWAMGDTGPCGPCSEIFYDLGPAASDKGHEDCQFGCDCGRYVEIWNLVFMQFNRDADGKLNPLPRPSVDTGAGLERLAAVLQGKISNFDTDLFMPLIREAEQHVDAKYGRDPKVDPSFRIVADHARATTFLIADGVIPSNEGRGYVLRKIMRRAIRHGRLNGATKPFLYEMVFAVADEMKAAYPELKDSKVRVAEIVRGEESRFANVMDIGLKRLDDDLAPLLAAKKENPQARAMYSGEKAFKLYDTFGLPLDFIIDATRDVGISFDQAGFDRAMAEQRTRAQASWKGGAKQTASPVFQQLARTVFEGYRQTESTGCEILALVRNGAGVQELKRGEQGEVVLDHTPFYAESGGQIGDRGHLYSPGRGFVVAEVESCYSPVQGVRAHKVI
ncbi:MAG: alanine--tRNA ligase, partial [Candidatus Acidiferrales bacterium]